MSKAVIVVRTANRPVILNRCIEAAVNGCDVSQSAHWIILDDSDPAQQGSNQEIARSWKLFGLNLSYVDKATVGAIASSLAGNRLRDLFTSFVARSSYCPTEEGRNLGLLAGLSLNPDMLFFIDDDIVHHHYETSCFFHWCANYRDLNNFVAAPRKLGISDMTYLNRLIAILDRDDYFEFISDTGISAKPDLWYSRENPLWKPETSDSNRSRNTISERIVVSGQLMALSASGTEWLPFPSEYNSDLNWSFLQSSLHGTALLKVSEINAQHLPLSLERPHAEAVLSELIGASITRALRQIRVDKERFSSVVTEHFARILSVELRRELFLLLDVDRALRHRLKEREGSLVHERLSKIKNMLAGVGEYLNSIDCRKRAADWIEDTVTRRNIFLELRQNESVQAQVRRALSH
jgi:hypothetical protein